MGAVQPPDTTPVVVTPAPVAEPGVTTSEYALLKPGAAIVGLAQAGLAVPAAFGVSITVAQTVAVEGFVAALVAAYAVYALGRSIRKSGTSG